MNKCDREANSTETGQLTSEHSHATGHGSIQYSFHEVFRHIDVVLTNIDMDDPIDRALVTYVMLVRCIFRSNEKAKINIFELFRQTETTLLKAQMKSSLFPVLTKCICV
jgi:hypothetical protein